MDKITITEIKVEADRKYRVMVLLQRSDRPRYWTFHCPSCTMPLCEMVNTEIVALSDLFDMQNVVMSANGIRCSGRTGDGRCNIHYYFTLNP